MSRELLHRALDALDYEFESEVFRNLCRDIRAELQKPEPVKELVEALKEAIDSGIVPISSASEGGANKYSRQVLAADRIRAAIAKYDGGKDEP